MPIDWSRITTGLRGVYTTSQSRHFDLEETIMPTLRSTDSFVHSALLARETCGPVRHIDMLAGPTAQDQNWILTFDDTCTRNIPVGSIGSMTPEQIANLFPENASIPNSLRGQRPVGVPTVTVPEVMPAIVIDERRVRNSMSSLMNVSFNNGSRVTVSDVTGDSGRETSHIARQSGLRTINSLRSVGITVPESMATIVGHAVVHTFSNPIYRLRELTQTADSLQADADSLREQLATAESAKTEAENQLARVEHLKTAALAWKSDNGADPVAKLAKFNALLEAVSIQTPQPVS